jgi:hypothetical protein
LPFGRTRPFPHSQQKGWISYEYRYHGKLLLDATCAFADIVYSTDSFLIDQAQEKLIRTD